MRERVEQFRSEPKGAVHLNTLSPLFRSRLARCSVIRGIDFNSVEVIRKVAEWIEAPRPRFRIHDPLPIFVGPACRSDSDHYFNLVWQEPGGPVVVKVPRQLSELIEQQAGIKCNGLKIEKFFPQLFTRSVQSGK